MHLPITLSPYLFPVTSVLFAAFSLHLLSQEVHSWLLADRRDRLILVAALVALPLGKTYMIANLTYSQWSLLFASLVLLTR